MGWRPLGPDGTPAQRLLYEAQRRIGELPAGATLMIIVCVDDNLAVAANMSEADSILALRWAEHAIKVPPAYAHGIVEKDPPD